MTLLHPLTLLLLSLTLLACTTPTPEPAPANDQWTQELQLTKDPQGTVLDRTTALIQSSGARTHTLHHPDRPDPAILAIPTNFIDGHTPLILSLHGYGSDSAFQSSYIPLHRYVNSRGFALLLPNGAPDPQGNRAWNPTDGHSQSGKASQDDIAYLTDLIAQARQLADFGPLYLFGYSNGGFMAYHLACKGLPNLRAVASLAGTSYLPGSACRNAPPVSVLHIHGTNDTVILYEGDQATPNPKSTAPASTNKKTNSDPAFYASARDMVSRWSQRANCPWPDNLQPYATLDLDQSVPGPETHARRNRSNCPGNITIELWTVTTSTHTPHLTHIFPTALLDWLLSQT